MNDVQSRHHIVLSVVLFKEGDSWVAQALEHDLAAQGPSIELAQRAFLHALAGQFKLDFQKNRQPLVHLPPAPMRYWHAWDQASAKQLLKAPTPTVASAEEQATIPPAYVIQAITDAPQVNQ